MLVKRKKMKHFPFFCLLLFLAHHGHVWAHRWYRPSWRSRKSGQPAPQSRKSQQGIGMTAEIREAREASRTDKPQYQHNRLSRFSPHGVQLTIKNIGTIMFNLILLYTFILDIFTINSREYVLNTYNVFNYVNDLQDFYISSHQSD